MRHRARTKRRRRIRRDPCPPFQRTIHLHRKERQPDSRRHAELRRTRGDNARCRGAHLRITQTQLRETQRRLRTIQRRLPVAFGGEQLLGIIDTERTVLDQLARPRRIALRLRQRRLGTVHRCLRLHHLLLQRRGIKQSQHLPGLHTIADIRLQLDKRYPSHLRIHRRQLARSDLTFSGKGALVRDALRRTKLHSERGLLLRRWRLLREYPRRQKKEEKQREFHVVSSLP